MLTWLLLLLIALAFGLLALWVSPPGQRLLARWQSERQARRRVRGEDALKHLYEWEILERTASAATLAEALDLPAAEAEALLDSLQARRLVRREGGRLRLAEPGREAALHVLRAHRLWERYLADETGVPAAEWHGRAHDREHSLTAAEVNDLAARLGHPTHDPHGDPIPTAEGEVLGPAGTPLGAAEAGRPLRILHIEDEPEAVFAHLTDLGLYAGMRVQILERGPGRLRLLADGHEVALPEAAAAAVTVLPLPPEVRLAPCAGLPLSDLEIGEAGHVVHVTRRCRPPERRRLMDLGVLPDTLVQVEMDSPGGNLKAYRVRDTLIALRPEQAALIHVRRSAAAEPEAVGAAAAQRSRA